MQVPAWPCSYANLAATASCRRVSAGKGCLIPGKIQGSPSCVATPDTEYAALTLILSGPSMRGQTHLKIMPVRVQLLRQGEGWGWMAGGTDSGPRHQILNVDTYHTAAPVSTNKIPSVDLSSLIAGAGAFSRGRGHMSPLAAVVLTGCSCNHFGSSAPPGAGQLKVGLLVKSFLDFLKMSL